jgi:hypothetical protein
MALAFMMPVAQAANPHTTTTSFSLAVVSLSCTSRAEPGCVNLATTLTSDPATGGARLCVDIGDFRESHPPVAQGCVDLAAGQFLVDDTGVVVQPAEVAAINTEDCFQAAPEDNCVPGTVALGVAASFAVTNEADRYQYTRQAVNEGACVTVERVRGLQATVTGTVTIDGFTYAISGADPSVHHFEAQLVEETVRSMTRCKGSPGTIATGALE